MPIVATMDLMTNLIFGKTKMRKTKHILCLLVFTISCVEPIELESIKTDSPIVIEASLTDEMRAHQVVVSRTTSLESTGFSPISDAIVWVEEAQFAKIQGAWLPTGRVEKYGFKENF